MDEVSGQKRIRFDPMKIAFKVTNQDGVEWPKANYSYDGFAPIWETIALPYAGSLRFQISTPGSGYNPRAKVMVDVGPLNVWEIPQDGSKYYLSGRLTIEAKEGDHPYPDWSGVLELPRTEIPQAAAF